MESVWHKNCSLPKFPQLKKDMKTEVLIIGGGIAGILTAYFMHKNNVPYILVEKDRICGGNTGNTTAKITFQHGLIYGKVLKNYGMEKAEIYLDANKSAFEKYKELCKNIECDYEIKDNYVYSINDRQKLEDEIYAVNKAGFKARLYDNIPLPFKTAGAVCFPSQAQFNPLKFLSAIAEGLNIYENTFVREINDNIAVTQYGKIHAGNIIIATHFPFLNTHGSYFLKLYQHRSYVIALEDAQDLNGMYVDDDKKGMSFRNYKNMLFIGGGGHRTGKNGGNWNELRNFAREKYPSAKEICHWSAQDCMSLDHMPYIGHYSKRTQNLYTASGFNKWGITGAMLSAMILNDLIMNRENEYAHLFTPSRNIIYPQLFINGFEAMKNLLTFSEKRCPHLGCALKWNNAEHSWDCACHGSRFDENGKNLDNPANGNMKI